MTRGWLLLNGGSSLVFNLKVTFSTNDEYQRDPLGKEMKGYPIRLQLQIVKEQVPINIKRITD
jgi:hypothetical protein